MIAWAQYSKNDMFNVQFGRFITPHGIINIEHFPANSLDPEQPQFLRPFPGQTIFANFSDGVNVHGSKYVGNNKFSYNAYAAAWAGNSSNLNIGGRLAYAFEDAGLTLGLMAPMGTVPVAVRRVFRFWVLMFFIKKAAGSGKRNLCYRRRTRPRQAGVLYYARLQAER
ncbi:MAG: hypothetical protein Q9M45_09150 [Robiginitomaculum sp.]|nr:hypothetical protein [Robiginitomaculum sp.]